MIREWPLTPRTMKLDITHIERGFPLDVVQLQYLIDHVHGLRHSVRDTGYIGGERCCDDHGFRVTARGTAIISYLPLYRTLESPGRASAGVGRVPPHRHAGQEPCLYRSRHAPC